ncbi:MAG: universal stress protein [Pseudomonadota bacterium]
MTRHILCAVDLSHETDARAILLEAGRLAERDSAGLSVICVLPDYGSSWVGSFFEEGTMKAAAKAALQALRDLVATALPNHGSVACLVEIGSVYDKVLEAIAEQGADLVIVGAHKPDLKDRLVGPNAARIVRHAPVSVLVMRL